MLAQWSLKDWEGFLVFLEGACKKDWECLDSTSVKHMFATMRGVDVVPKDIPNGVLQALYDEYLMIHVLKNRGIEPVLRRAVAVSDLARSGRYSGSGRSAAARARFRFFRRGRVGCREGHV